MGKQVSVIFVGVDGDKRAPVDLQAQTSWLKKQVNLQPSMVYKAIYGIEVLDLEVEFYKKSERTQVADAMTLRYVMYNYMKMESSHSLFVDIHQEGDFVMVQVVVGNTPEAEQTIMMINKQPVVFSPTF